MATNCKFWARESARRCSDAITPVDFQTDEDAIEEHDEFIADDPELNDSEGAVRESLQESDCFE